MTRISITASRKKRLPATAPARTSSLPPAGNETVSPAPMTEEQARALVQSVINTPADFFVPPGRKNHLLENYLPGPGSVSILVAAPGVGKTTLIADFVFTFAYKHRYAPDLGSIEVPDPLNDAALVSLPLIEYGTFLGQRITQPPAPVLYVALEGKRQLQLLGAAYEEHIHDFIDLELATGPDNKKKKSRLKFKKAVKLENTEAFHPVLTLTDHNLYLNTPKEKVERLKREGKPTDMEDFCKIMDALQLLGSAPRIVVFDTARMVLDGEEDSSTEVGELLRNTASIAKKYQCACILLHHPGVSSQRARGSGAWEGNSDCVWELSGDARTCVTIKVKKLKGFALPPDLYFRIVPHETSFLDFDDPGKFLSSAGIEHLPEAVPLTRGKKTKSGGLDKEAVDATAEKLSARRKRTPAQKHDERQRKRIETLHAAYQAMGDGDTDENGAPYITRAALAEYMTKELSLAHATIVQAMKPSADTSVAVNLIGPLLADNLIAKHEHGWVLLFDTASFT